jgi:hypothetical protein
MITEFGVPTGLGAAHLGPQGRDQGDHSEQEAATMDAAMLRDIRRAGFAGGVLFEYTDEWFKRTWNTVDLAQPADRRALWQNVLTNEAQFGVVAVEPGRRASVTVDGRTRDWRGVRPLLRGRTQVSVRHDAAYLYLLVRHPSGTLGFDVRAGENGGRPGVPAAAEFALTLGPGRRARLEQAAWTDPVARIYGVAHAYVPVNRDDLRPGSGAWVSPRLILNRPYTLPSTGEQRPVELLDLGVLRWGTADPRARHYDGRVLAAGDGRTVELRLPWMLLGLADPSAHRVYDAHDDGTVTTLATPAIGISAGGATAAYRWPGWNRVAWHERRKAGWSTLRRAFAQR